MKEERHKLILDYLVKRKGNCNRTEIKAMLDEKGYEVDLTTISRDIKELNYERVGDHHYVVAVPAADKRNKEILKNLFANNPPSFLGPYLLPHSSTWNMMFKSLGALSTDDNDTEDYVTEEAKKKPGKGLRLFVIQVTNGFESTISGLISSIYKNIIVGCIPGNGCVLVLTIYSRSYNTIRKELRALSPGQSGGNKEQ